MAYTEGVTLEVEYTFAPVGNTFSYSTIETTDSFPEAAQVSVLWQVVTMETPGGDPVLVSELPASAREQIYRLSDTYLTFNEGAKTVTVDGVALSGATVTVTSFKGAPTDYVYPDFTLINSANPVVIRRDVNITNPVVDFQKGSRLTSEQLNAGVQQLLFAAQEQSIFGTSSELSEVDLSDESINNLGDVSINLTNAGALLVVGNDGVISDSTTSDTNAVLSVNGATGVVVLDETDVGAAPLVHTHPISDLTDLPIDFGTPVDGETLVYNGTNFVPHAAVTVSTGTGAPPTEWITDPNRRPGDLYVRTG
jgi:hypothetical protein